MAIKRSQFQRITENGSDGLEGDHTLSIAEKSSSPSIANIKERN